MESEFLADLLGIFWAVFEAISPPIGRCPLLKLRCYVSPRMHTRISPVYTILGTSRLYFLLALGAVMYSP
jgi:hypothetical protein